MSGDWFDALAAALARARPRRAMAAALAAALTSGAVVPGGGPALAGQVYVEPACRGKGAKCRRGGQCCSGRCRKRKGKNGKKRRGVCRCSRYLEPCKDDGDCCSGDLSLVCASGKCET
jgi:hypothetical protein